MEMATIETAVPNSLAKETVAFGGNSERTVSGHL